MIEQKILNELKKLSNTERLAIIESALNMIRKDLQSAEQSQELKNRKQRLSEAARLLLPDYANDDELTAFTVLDSEDFHA